MPSKRDPSFRRLSSIFRAEEEPLKLAERAFEADILRPAGLSWERIMTNEAAFNLAAGSALRLNVKDPKDRAILSAFSHSRLDPRNPLHWRILLQSFAHAHFGKAKTKPKKDAADFWQIYSDCVLIKVEAWKAGKTLKTQTDVAKALQRHPILKNKYPGNVDNIRKLIRKAENPKYNIALRYPDTPDFLKLARAVHEDEGGVWTAEVEALYAKAFRGLGLPSGNSRPVAASARIIIDLITRHHPADWSKRL